MVIDVLLHILDHIIGECPGEGNDYHNSQQPHNNIESSFRDKTLRMILFPAYSASLMVIVAFLTQWWSAMLHNWASQTLSFTLISTHNHVNSAAVPLHLFTGCHVWIKTKDWYTLLHMLRFPRRVSERYSGELWVSHVEKMPATTTLCGHDMKMNDKKKKQRKKT